MDENYNLSRMEIKCPATERDLLPLPGWRPRKILHSWEFVNPFSCEVARCAKQLRLMTQNSYSFHVQRGLATAWCSFHPLRHSRIVCFQRDCCELSHSASISWSSQVGCLKARFEESLTVFVWHSVGQGVNVPPSKGLENQNRFELIPSCACVCAFRGKPHISLIASCSSILGLPWFANSYMTLSWRLNIRLRLKSLAWSPVGVLQCLWIPFWMFMNVFVSRRRVLKLVQSENRSQRCY